MVVLVDLLVKIYESWTIVNHVSWSLIRQNVASPVHTFFFSFIKWYCNVLVKSIKWISWMYFFILFFLTYELCFDQISFSLFLTYSLFLSRYSLKSFHPLTYSGLLPVKKKISNALKCFLLFLIKSKENVASSFLKIEDRNGFQILVRHFSLHNSLKII